MRKNDNIRKEIRKKKKALINLVKSGEYTIAYALMEAERLNDEGKLLDNDYEEVAEYLESLLEPEAEEVEELVDTEENTDKSVESEEQ